ncbi:MAG: hypothetical protein AB7U97_18725 [Pirellulales bacterium]
MSYTIVIPDDLFRVIVQRAVAEEKTIRTVILEALCRGLGIEFIAEWAD